MPCFELCVCFCKLGVHFLGAFVIIVLRSLLTSGPQIFENSNAGLLKRACRATLQLWAASVAELLGALRSQGSDPKQDGFSRIVCHRATKDLVKIRILHNHDCFNFPPGIEPWNPNVASLCFCGLLRRLYKPKA